MSDLKLFFKENKKEERASVFYPVTKAFVDENGEPVKWEFKPMSIREMDTLRDQFIKEIPVPGKPGMYRNKVDNTALMMAMAAECCVFPDLRDGQLQDSYQVKTPEDLLYEMIGAPGEKDDLLAFVSEINGFNAFDSKVEQAKNL